MFDIDRRLHRLAQRHKGLVVRELAMAEGITRSALDDRVAAGILIVLHEGIYRHAAAPYTQELRELAAVLACGRDAYLSHRSAATKQGYPNVRRVKPEVTSPHTDLPRVDGVTLHRTNRYTPSEIVVIDGIRVSNKGRTALDLCAVTPLWIAQEVITEAVIMKIVRPQELMAALERSGGRGCPGTADLRTIVAGLDDIEGIESMLELEVDRALVASSLPPAVRQHPLTCSDGRQVRLDWAWPEFKVSLDANGRRWHDTPTRRKRTRERHESIVATGWEHLERGWSDAMDRPAEIPRAVEAAITRFVALTGRRPVSATKFVA